MTPERDNYQALLESLADGVEVDWSALDSAATTDAERRRYRNLRLVARVAELHRTLVLDDDDVAPSASPLANAAPADDPTTWGHLSVHARLASGAFGRIYRAHDPQLNREVALKLLHGDVPVIRSVDHLLAEARTLAKVHHPNVVTVYGADIRDGRAGLWMELVDGQTLEAWLRANGAMGRGEVSAVGIDLCRALAAVHAAGLVHGDVKAQNVMREQGGRIVLMDFGAGRVQGADAHGVTGTPMYLAPEVLAGEPPTPRSDLYSLGVLLFHLLTAGYPYAGEDLDSLRAAHADGIRTWLRDLRPDLPDRLVQSIERAIDADPARRFATAGAMERAFPEALESPGRATETVPVPAVVEKSVTSVQWSRFGFAIGALALLCVVVGLVILSRGAGAPVTPGVRSIAVLPMTDLSGSQHAPFLADGLHDQLITTLGQIQSLRVMSRTSVMRFKGSHASAGEIAKQLGVDAVLESTMVSTEGASAGTPGRVRVNASLMTAGASTPLWSSTYDRPLGDLLALEAEVARAIAASVRATITPSESARLSRPQQTNPAAEEAYLQGRMNLAVFGADSARRALDAFERALKLDPSYAAANAGAAYAYIVLDANRVITHQKARALALAHARRALELRDDLAEAHATMADIEFFYDWNMAGAEQEYRTSLDLNPSLTSARSHYAEFLAATGRFDESLIQADLAEDLGPGDAPTLTGLLLYYKRDYPAAEKAIRAALSLRPDAVALHILLGRVSEAQGRMKDAVEATRDAMQLSGSGVPLRVQMIRLEALSGHPDRARESLRDLEAVTSQRSQQVEARDLAYISLAFGDRDGALDAFDRALEERDPTLVWLGVDPRVDALRPYPRFAAMLKQLGLQERTSVPRMPQPRTPQP
jgi:serine/threonine protein kinase/tetratricopeptide (TPR) repeat protein